MPKITRTDAHRAADRKRYAEKLKGKVKLVGAQLPAEEAEAFAAECARRCVSQSAVIKAAITEFMKEGEKC